MKVLNFRDFMKKYNIKNDTMKESELQRIQNYPIYPRDSKIYSDRGFVNIDDGSQGGSHWTCSMVKHNKSHYFDSFVGQPDKLLPKQKHKPIKNHNYKIQDTNSELCGSYCLYFFYLIDTNLLFYLIYYYDTILKKYFS